MDRYPMLANLDYVGKAHDYSYDFLAMQAVRCQRYRELTAEPGSGEEGSGT